MNGEVEGCNYGQCDDNDAAEELDSDCECPDCQAARRDDEPDDTKFVARGVDLTLRCDAVVLPPADEGDDE